MNADDNNIHIDTDKIEAKIKEKINWPQEIFSKIFWLKKSISKEAKKIISKFQKKLKKTINHINENETKLVEKEFLEKIKYFSTKEFFFMSIIIEDPSQKVIKIKGFVINDGSVTNEYSGPFIYNIAIVYNGANIKGITGPIRDLKKYKK